MLLGKKKKKNLICNIPSSYNNFNEVEFSKEDSKII